MQRSTLFVVKIVTLIGDNQAQLRALRQIRWIIDHDATASDMGLEGLHVAEDIAYRISMPVGGTETQKRPVLEAQLKLR